MSLYSFRKKEEKPCCCSGNEKTESKKVETDCAAQKITSIKVLGSGCRACHDLFENVQTAALNIGLATTVEYITDMQQVVRYGAMSMPAIVVNEKVVSMGKVLKPADVEKLLRKQ